MKTLVAHQPFNESDRFPIWCPAGDSHLKGGFMDRPGLATLEQDRVDLGDPPIVVPGARSCSNHKGAVVRRPIVIVNMQAGWRDLANRAGACVQYCNPLVVDVGVDD